MNKEQFLEMLPELIGKYENITGFRIQKYGCFGFDIVPGELKEYEQFCEAMDDAGFVRHARVDGMKNLFYNTTYMNEEYVVMISHITVHHKVWVSGYPRALHTELTAKEVFTDVPVMEHMGQPLHYGADNFVAVVESTKKQDYKEYLSTLEKAGYTKYVENEEGLGGTVFSATYTKNEKVVTVTYFSKTAKTTISAYPNLPLSEHLHNCSEYTANMKVGAKTKLHMLELYYSGNSFVFQLKNGHFIISDGGTWEETEYLLDYLEQLTPEGEKPVVEAWVLSHPHDDHTGAMYSIPHVPGATERIYVEGVYFSEPNDNALAFYSHCAAEMIYTKEAVKMLRTSKGEETPLYRPQTGQRYYFCDVTMDIVHSQEHLPIEEYSGDVNDSSTWVLFTIEGQKCLFCGDGETGSTKAMIRHYDSEYLDLTLYTLQHHGHNTRDDFTDYSTIKTVLATVKNNVPASRIRQNEYLKEKAKEWLVWGDGTKVLTFPYEVGTYETLPHFEWIYHKK